VYVLGGAENGGTGDSSATGTEATAKVNPSRRAASDQGECLITRNRCIEDLGASIGLGRGCLDQRAGRHQTLLAVVHRK
jgi:hypothetical protein